jgi:DNA-binding transcriptional regulator LsrR (DeoR family)
MSRDDMEALMAIGVVGDIVAHQFDENGRWMDIPANRRAISLDADSPPHPRHRCVGRGGENVPSWLACAALL